MPVCVVQKGREKDETLNGVKYSPTVSEQPKDVITLRIPQVALRAKRDYPNARHYLWLHDLADQNLAQTAQDLVDARITLIVVSEFHKLNVLDVITRNVQIKGKIDIRVIYNPITDGLCKDSTPVKANKLVFFSSPHKGLEHTLKVFECFQYHAEIKDSKLYIANPGYFTSSTPLPPGVVNLGVLPHKDVVQHVRESLCVLHLNHVFPETFGLVYAEANAVGTPFITHPFGAASEVSDHPAQLLDVRDPKRVIDRVIAWRSGARPKVLPNEEFYMKNVRKKWLAIL